MQRIAIAAAEPGMVLAQAVSNPDGMVLAGAGLVLSQEAITRLRNTGIASIMVDGDAGSEVCGELERVSGQLPHLFRKYKGDPFMMTLHNMLGKYFAYRIASFKEAEALRAKAAKQAKEAAKEAAGAAEEAAVKTAGEKGRA